MKGYIVSKVMDNVYGEAPIGIATTRGAAMRAAAYELANDLAKEFKEGEYSRCNYRVTTRWGHAGRFTWGEVKCYE